MTVMVTERTIIHIQKKEIKTHKLAFSLLNRKHSIKRNIEHYKLGLEIGRN